MPKKAVLQIAVTLLLLGVLGYTMDWRELGATLSRVRVAYLLGGIAVLISSGVPAALRLQFLLRPTPFRFSWPRLMEVNFISMFYGQFLPAGVGTTTVRWFKITGNKTGRRVFLLVTLLEHLMLVSSLLLCVAVPLYLEDDPRVATLRKATLPILAVLGAPCLFALACCFSRSLFGRAAQVCRWLQGKTRFAFLQKIVGIYEDVGLYAHRRGVLCAALGCHIVYQGFLFLGCLLFFRALGLDLNAGAVLWVSMLVLLLQAVPVSQAGYGVREMSFAKILAVYGIAAETGALVGAMLSVDLMACGLLGAILALFEAKRKKRDNPKEE